MIELTEEQARTMEEKKGACGGAQPADPGGVRPDPQGRLRQRAHDFLRPLGRAWDNPDDDDLIRRDK